MPHRRRHSAEQGQTAVEFALVAPILIVLLLGIVQAGIAFHNYITVTDAARAAARRAILLRVGNVTSNDVTTAADNAAGDLDQSQLKVKVDDATDPFFTQGGSTVTVTVTYPYSINVLGWAVASGDLTSVMTDRLE